MNREEELKEKEKEFDAWIKETEEPITESTVIPLYLSSIKSPKTKRMKNEEALKKVGLDYSSFDIKEITKIISDIIVNKKGIKKTRYESLTKNVSNPKELITNLIKHSNLERDVYLEFVKECQEKRKELREADLAKKKERRAALDKEISELEKEK